MNDALIALSTALQTSVWPLAAVFLRVGAMVFLLPMFGGRSIPMRVKLAIGFTLTFVIAPLVPVDPGWAQGSVGLMIRVIALEALSGVGFGLLLRFFVHGLQVAGALAAQSTSLSQIFGGSVTTDSQSAFGNVLTLGGLTLAVLAGLHLRLVEYLVLTYDLVPFGGLFAPDDLAQIGLAQIVRCFALGFALAAPFILTSVLYNVTLGVINRAMPQLMVAFIGAPAITAAGLIMLTLCAPLMLSLWVEALNGFMRAPWVVTP